MGLWALGGPGTLIAVVGADNSGVVVSCSRCGAEQLSDAEADWYVCGTCHRTRLLRRCPACATVVHLDNLSGRVSCPMCGRGFSRRRWDKNAVSAVDAYGESDVHARLAKADTDHRVIAGFVVAVAGVEALSPGEATEIEFTGAGITLWYSDADGDLAEHDVSYDKVDYLRVFGRGEMTTTTDAGLSGGALSLAAGIEGAAITSLINSLTRTTKTTIETFVHLKARRTEVLLLETTTPPHILSVRLGPAFDLIDDAQRRKSRAAATQLTTATVADQLVKLSELHEAGLLTADEFAAAKRRVLDRPAP